MFRIGPFVIDNPTILAPMAGVTDLPFRRLCRSFGAGMTVSEMLTADTGLWSSNKSRFRLPHSDEPEPRVIQIAGAEPRMLADAAVANVQMGAQIIDINMGCPAKKVCRRAAGSALLRDQSLVADILNTVVRAVTVPVTLKIRTGWDTDHRNGVEIARIAEECGIQALAVHGRTRACGFRGSAEYDTIASIVAAVDLPVFANGDIRSPEQARAVLDYTGAAAVMIGRGAQGRPWIFREINRFLAYGTPAAVPDIAEIEETLTSHIRALHGHYGPDTGVRIARKHLGWYLTSLVTEGSGLGQSTPGDITDIEHFRRTFNRLENPAQQLSALRGFFKTMENIQDIAA